MKFKLMCDDMQNKNYVAPSIEIIQLEVEELICASGGSQLSSYEGGESSVGI